MKDLFSPHVELKDLSVAENLLKESRTGFFKLFNSSPACMSLTTLERIYVRVNEKFLEKFGFTEEEIIGRNSLQIGILDKEEMEKVGALIREKGRLQNDLVVCRAKNGKKVHAVSSIERIEFNGQTYLMSTFLDITDRMNMEEKLKQVNKDLDSFSYSVSHDLRAPLRAIHGYVKILEEDYGALLDEEGKRVIGVVRANALKMGKLIDDLLAFSRLGKKELSKTTIDMNVLTATVVSELKTSVCRAEIAIEELHPVIGNLDLLSQVMTNLVSNAIKYSSKKENPVIQISSEKKNNEIIFSVKDNGSGFDMAYVGKLFEVFQRLHSQSEFEGTGVGLAIVYRIIINHGGRVWADAKVNEGAIFCFALPAY
ncbi:MAG: sensor histidine kinase [Bacteroidia bacterium]